MRRALNTSDVIFLLFYSVRLTKHCSNCIIKIAVEKAADLEESVLKQNVAVMDLGTSKITVLIGSRGINNSICIEGIGVCDYDGYSGGEWLGIEYLGSAIAQAIDSARNSARVDIDKLYVGVPCEFSMCEVKDVAISLNKKRCVTSEDVEALFARGDEYADDPDWAVINIYPIYYTLDDNRKLIVPEGMVSTRLGGSISYMLGQRDFIDIIDIAAKGAGIPETEFVSVPLAETLFLFDDSKRDGCVMLADIGALGTALSIGRGDGICRQYYFPWGGECITSALAESLEISPEEAEKLKRKVILSLDPNYTLASSETGIMLTEYTVESGGEKHSYRVSEVNSVVANEINRFARYIQKVLAVCDYKYPEYIPLSITGGGLNYIRGAAEYLADCLECDVERVQPNLPMLDLPHLSAPFGLMDMVLASEDGGASMFGKLKRWFTARKSRRSDKNKNSGR